MHLLVANLQQRDDLSVVCYSEATADGKHAVVERGHTAVLQTCVCMCLCV